MSGPRMRPKSVATARRERSWLDVILEIDDEEEAPRRPVRRSTSRPSVAPGPRVRELARLPASRSVPAVSQGAATERVTGEGGEGAREAEAGSTMVYSRAQAFAGGAPQTVSLEAIQSAYLEAKKEMGARMHAEEQSRGHAAVSTGLERWQQDALVQQLQLELQAVRRQLLEAGKERETLRHLVRERQAQAAEDVRAERARRQQAEAALALVRRERDLLSFSAGLGDVTAAQRQQEEKARELLEGEVRVLKRSLLLAHEQATSGGGDGVAECLAAVKGLLADVAHNVEDFQRSGVRLQEVVNARQKLETAAVTKLRDLLQRQQPSPEQHSYLHHVTRVEEALARVEQLYDLAASDRTPPSHYDVPACPKERPELCNAHEAAPLLLEVSLSEVESLRRSTSDSELVAEAPAVHSPALTFTAPREYASNPEILPSTASLLLFGGAPPE